MSESPGSLACAPIPTPRDSGCCSSAGAGGGYCAPAAPGPDPEASPRQDCVEQLLRNMFDGAQTEGCLVSGTQVLLTLLETRRPG